MIESEVVGRIEVGDEVAPGAQAAARYVHEDIIWPQALADHELDLHFPDLFPHAADIAAVTREVWPHRTAQPSVLVQQPIASRDGVDYVDQLTPHLSSRFPRYRY